MSLKEVTRNPSSSRDRAAAARVVVALGHGPGAGNQILHRLHQALRRKEGAVDRGYHRHQHHETQDQHECGLEGPAQLHQIGVLSVGALHGIRQLAQLQRHGIQRDQHPPAAAAVIRGAPRRESRSRRPHPYPRLTYGRPRRNCSIISSVAGAGRASIGRSDSELVAMIRACAPTTVNSMRRAVAPLAIQRGRQLKILQCRQRMRHALRVLQKLPLAHLQRRVRQLARILQSLADLQFEPAVDAAVQELQGEIIDDQDWRHGQRAEYRHRAPLETRPRHMPAKVAHQARELAGQQHDQRDQPEMLTSRIHGSHFSNFCRVLRGRGQQIQRNQPQQPRRCSPRRWSRTCGSWLKSPCVPVAFAMPVADPEHEQSQAERHRAEIDFAAQHSPRSGGPPRSGPCPDTGRPRTADSCSIAASRVPTTPAGRCSHCAGCSVRSRR